MNNEEKSHKSKLSELGCMLCRVLYNITDGPVELHHLRTGGWGKGDYKTLIPLCVEHHRGKSGIHGMGTKAFDAFYGKKGGSQSMLLEKTLSILENKSNPEKQIYF